MANLRADGGSNGDMPPPPQPLPDTIWGDRWQFASLTAADLEERLLERPIPVRHVMPLALPSQQQLPATTIIPGISIEAGRRAMPLARWLAQRTFIRVNAVQRELGALIARTSTQEQWILATYQDEAVAEAGQAFEARKGQSQGIHFLLIQPDDAGVTHTGLWLMREII
jgi:hypothetical protein